VKPIVAKHLDTVKIHINDLVDNINSSIRLFADDTTLFLSVNHGTTREQAEVHSSAAADQLNSDLNSIKQWADRWLVNFNPGKTKAMAISNRTFEHPPLFFDNIQLSDISEHKHLGITLTSNLSWSAHINNIINNASKVCQVLRRLKFIIDRKSLETIYMTFIRPKLEYACQIWDDCTNEDKAALEKVQLNAARIVTGAKKGTSHELLRHELQWPTLAERRSRSKLIQMHKMVNNTAPSYLTSLLPEKVDTRYNLRHEVNGCYRQFKFRLEKFKGSLLPDLIRKWNALDPNSKLITDIKEFKKKITHNISSNPLFYFGDRKANIIHSQLRMHCSNLRHHLYELHVIDDPVCLCGLDVEDTKHYFMNCPLYNTNRTSLINTINALSNFSVDVILYGDDNIDIELNCIIFAAVHDFILESERFN